MKRKQMSIDNAGIQRLATTKFLPFVYMSNDELATFETWFKTHYEDEFKTPRERSFFRRNRGQCYAEKKWRNGEIPF